MSFSVSYKNYVHKFHSLRFTILKAVLLPGESGCFAQ